MLTRLHTASARHGVAEMGKAGNRVSAKTPPSKQNCESGWQEEESNETFRELGRKRNATGFCA